MGSRSAVVTRGMRNGQTGWLLRWREYSLARGGRLQSYWFVDEQEARAVCEGLRAGEPFEVAFRRVWVTP